MRHGGVIQNPYVEYCDHWESRYVQPMGGVIVSDEGDRISVDIGAEYPQVKMVESLNREEQEALDRYRRSRRGGEQNE